MTVPEIGKCIWDSRRGRDGTRQERGGLSIHRGWAQQWLPVLDPMAGHRAARVATGKIASEDPRFSLQGLELSLGARG